MKTELSFTVHNLLTRKDNKVTGPQSTFQFAKDMVREVGEKFNRLARVSFSDEEVLQGMEDDGLTTYNHLIIANQYKNDLVLSLWVDMGTDGMPVAMCCKSDRELIVTPIYRKASFARKLSEEEIAVLFDHIFSNPGLLDIIPGELQG